MSRSAQVEADLTHFIVVTVGLPRHAFSIWSVHEKASDYYIVRIDPIVSGKRDLIPASFEGTAVRVEDRSPAISGWSYDE
jgi:hypothetical protein